MNNEFVGRKILITGAANGLGLAMAEYLAERGADLALTDIDAESIVSVSSQMNEKSRGRILGLTHDVACEDSWQAVHDEVASQWSALHGLVNNAGIMIHKPFPQTTLEMFRKTQSINVDSVFIGIKTFLSLLKAGGAQQDAGSPASIVNVSSVFGQVAGPVHSAYCASKGAVRLLTKSIAAELPRLGYNIRCNSIHPGIMDAGVSVSGMQALVDMGQFANPEEAGQFFAEAIPMGRPGKSEEIAAGVSYLLSVQSNFMNGAELTLDGGYSAV